MTDLDLDAIEREARACFNGGYSFVDPGKILALVAEVRELRARAREMERILATYSDELGIPRGMAPCEGELRRLLGRPGNQ